MSPQTTSPVWAWSPHSGGTEALLGLLATIPAHGGPAGGWEMRLKYLGHKTLVTAGMSSSLGFIPVSLGAER